MNWFVICLFGCLLSALEASKIVCFYKGEAYHRKGQAHIEEEHLKQALPSCDYLIYGYAGLDPITHSVVSLDPKLELEIGKNYYRRITGLKNIFPNVKVLLSVGGYADYLGPVKYLTLLEMEKFCETFIKSSIMLAKNYSFDGIDLAWQFPLHIESKYHTPSGILWGTVQKYASFVIKDNRKAEHKKQFTNMCQKMYLAMQQENMTLTMSVLPNTDYRSYFDADALKDCVEHIHLMAFDYKNPDKTPNEADYSSPLNPVPDRDPQENVQTTIGWWLNSSVPAYKLILGIPTYGRSWKLTWNTGTDPTPPLMADGPGDVGIALNLDGYVSYYDMCDALVSKETLKKRVDRYGLYAYKMAPGIFDTGAWVSYEDVESVFKKTRYAVSKGMGGIAIFDLSMDDFLGHCSIPPTPFPLLGIARKTLMPETEIASFITSGTTTTESEVTTTPTTQEQESPAP